MDCSRKLLMESIKLQNEYELPIEQLKHPTMASMHPSRPVDDYKQMNIKHVPFYRHGVIWSNRLLRMLGTIILFLPCALSQSWYCTQLPEPARLSDLHSVLRNSMETVGTVRLCAGFSISGDRCDEDGPFKVTKGLKVYCENVYGASGVCEISCPGSHFIVQGGTQLILNRMILKGATSGSITVNTQGNLSAIQCTWEGNKNEGGSGGAIYNESGSGVLLYYSRIIWNSAADHGGGMYIKGQLRLLYSEINNNRAESGRGGAMLIASGSYVRVQQCVFLGNIAQELGPAICSESAPYQGVKNEGCGNIASTAECNGVYDVNSEFCTPFYNSCSSPSEVPSSSPISSTWVPSSLSTLSPSFSPSNNPNPSPSWQPSSYPSRSPLASPSLLPSEVSSQIPSRLNSKVPTLNPSFSRRASSSPTPSPSLLSSSPPSHTQLPSTVPSQVPSSLPSTVPSNKPSISPSFSQDPSSSPSTLPSNHPTPSPSWRPSSTPSHSQLPSVSSLPSTAPSQMPSILPTTIPSNNPSTSPQATPSSNPSTTPPPISSSTLPTSNPIASTFFPSSRLPSSVSSTKPSSYPSWLPTSAPTPSSFSSPSSELPLTNIFYDSGLPPKIPSNKPSPSPSSLPSKIPSIHPFPSSIEKKENAMV